MQDLKILALQSDIVWQSPEKNRQEFEKKIIKDFDTHDLVILPETFTTGFPVDPIDYSEDIDGPTMLWLKKLSTSLNTVICGSFLLNDNGNYSNTLIWHRPDGTFERYDKRHVFSMGGEHEKITAGKTQLIVELNGWKIKPMICYDLRFPVWSKNTYTEEGGFEYDLAIYIANWPAVRDYPWKQLLFARAIENIACVVGLNRIGEDGPGNKYVGTSMIIDAKGQILDNGFEAMEKALSVILSASDLISFRKKFNVGLDWDDFAIS